MPKKFILLGAVLVLGVLGAGFVLAWTEPSQAPPEGNIPKPINEGPATQTKEGGFNTIGNMGVNITSPAHGMTVNKKAIGVGNWDGAGDTVSGLQFGNSGTEHAGIRFDGTANLFLEMASASADPDTWYDAATALNLIIRKTVWVQLLTPIMTEATGEALMLVLTFLFINILTFLDLDMLVV